MKYTKDQTRKKNANETKGAELIKHINQDLLKFYESDYASLLLPQDQKILRDVTKLLSTKKEYSDMIVVGIGGSNLGTIAINEAIHGKNHLHTKKKKLFFADTVDPDSLNDILNMVKKKKFLLTLISKSGNTTESIANFEVLLNKIPKKERKDRVIIITDKDSNLEKYAQKKEYSYLNVPAKVGGRYSVFSSVGLLPLAFSEIKVKDLLQGATDAIENFNKNNVALQGALDLHHNYENNKTINDIFLFSNELESLGKWFRQLMGESLGKKLSLDKTEVFMGITPTISIGSTDLHSVGQLYLGGPRDKFTSFVSLSEQTKITVPKNEDLILKDIQGLNFQEIMDAILKGTMKAYTKNKLPFNHYELENKSEYELGYFMQTKMLEIMILAHLLNVDAFDQPSVEDYKKETRKLLKKIN